MLENSLLHELRSSRAVCMSDGNIGADRLGNGKSIVSRIDTRSGAGRVDESDGDNRSLALGSCCEIHSIDIA